MNQFIAYFDYLGFKDFIENNSFEDQIRIMGYNFRDIEDSLGQGQLKHASHGVVANMSECQVNCINFSDTVVFYTNDTRESSLCELIKVAYRFNWRSIDFCFPVRGALVYGEIISVDFRQNNMGGGVYNVNSIFGKGLVAAHLKANEQNWAGTVIDGSLITEIKRKGYAFEKCILPYAKKYRVPYKSRENTDEEYVLNIIEGELNKEAFESYSNGIIANFANHNKSVADNEVQQKLSNTLEFLKSYRAK